VKVILSLLILLFASFVMWGIGSAARRLTNVPQGHWPVSIGIGLATLICAGGVLNLLHIAYAPVLWVLVLLGAILAALELRRSQFSLKRVIPREMAVRAELALATLSILAVMIFTISTQLPPREFNYHDDLQKYFAHPVRMLATGTLRASPLSALGSETLGGKAFLDAFVVSVLPIQYLNATDAVFGFFVLMLIAASAGWRRFGWFPGSALGVALVTVINPQYANTTALYLGAALIASAVMIVADDAEEASPVLLGIVYAALIALKPTFGPFVLFHLPLAILAPHKETSSWRQTFAWASRLALWTTAAFLPWLAVHLPTYLSKGTFSGAAVTDLSDAAQVKFIYTVNVLDGDNIASYTAIAALGAFVGVLALIASALKNRGTEPADRATGLLAGTIAGAAAFFLSLGYLSLWTGYQSSIRYVVPMLLGSCVISFLLAPSLRDRLPRFASVMLPCIFGLAIFAGFVPGAIARYRQARRYGSILEFRALADSPNYLDYMSFALSDAPRRQVAGFQQKVPQGEPLFAWINMPYLLDYGRNSIVDVDIAGLGTRWAHTPRDVHYYLWQYRGYAVRTEGDLAFRAHEPGIGARDRLIGRRALQLANQVTELAAHAKIIANDDQLVLFYVSDPAGL